MKIALTIWGNRISPVFESANTLMIVDVENLKINSRVYERFDPQISKFFLQVLQKNKIDILICGAITDAQSTFIKQNEIGLIPFISGNADRVVDTLINEKHRISDFLMPGVVLDLTSMNNIAGGNF
ncbi:MAG: dinitrogenase iron-molybdenum cofactor biosynthesis domain-containing protein [Desulfobacteraceae bacterium]|nr:dinitrogenase iron-molybdenum cofactor biosynthesis domain-containing protein [Desulfobacteraceae bacterium]